ncbi:membrane transporter (hexose transporter) [Seiridium cupressi]
MAAPNGPPLDLAKAEKGHSNDDGISQGHVAQAGSQDILALQDLDPALNMKMHLVNNAIDEIGWTPYHWKLFVLNGFGYAVDSLILLLQSVIATQAFTEFGRKFEQAKADRDVSSCSRKVELLVRGILSTRLELGLATMFTAGALVFVMSVLRVTVIRLKETPKYLLGIGDDAALVESLQSIAKKYNRPCSLTLEQLDACGTVQSAHSGRGFSASEALIHLRGLFGTKQLALSTGLIWLSWTLIGLAYPLFYVFLNTYLASRGATAGVSTYDTWRNYALTNVSGIFGPMLAGWMCNLKFLGRKYTMVIGALVTMAFFFAYTAVKTPAQNVGFSCAIGFCLNIYYGTLYAYTPEVLPSAHRATGNGIAVACNRIMGIISAVVGTTADTTTSVPIYVCAALFIGMAAVSAVFPFEPYGRRSS